MDTFSFNAGRLILPLLPFDEASSVDRFEVGERLA